MAYEDLKLIKCFRFDKDKQRWGMCDEWVSKYKANVYENIIIYRQSSQRRQGASFLL